MARRGRGGSRRAAQGRLSLAARFAGLFQGSGANRDVWLDADSVGAGNGPVDRNDATHTFAVTGALAAPAPRVGLNNKNVLQFTGTQRAVSSRTATNWQFLHSGAGMTFVSVFELTSLATQNLFSTAPTSLGYDQLCIATGAAFSRVQNSAVTIFSTNVASQFALLTPTFTVQTYSESALPKQEFRLKSSVIGNTAPSGAPLAAPSPTPLVIGADSAGSAPASMYWRATYAFHRVLQAADLQTLYAYITNDAGITP